MPLPPRGLLSKELVNVPVQFLYARNELLKKIIAITAKRKAQLHMDATGARMATTPEAFQFGENVFKGMHKKALSPWMKTLKDVAGRAVSGVKTYGKRLVGDSTMVPLRAQQDALRGLEKKLVEQAGQRIDTQPLTQQTDLIREMLHDLMDYRRGLRRSPKDVWKEVYDRGAQSITDAGRLFPGRLTASTNQQHAHTAARARAAAGAASENLRRTQGLFSSLVGKPNLRAGQPGFQPGLLDLTDQSLQAKLKELAAARAHNATHTDIWHRQLPDVYRKQVAANTAAANEMEAIRKTRQYTADTATVGGLAGLGGLAYANSGEKQSSVDFASPLAFALPPAALGATAGGLYGAVMGPRKKKLRAILKGLVSGGLMGGGAGLGMGLGGEFAGRTGGSLPFAGTGIQGLINRGNRAQFGALAGAPLGAVGGGALGALLADRVNASTDALLDGEKEKDAADMPQPTSRGETKKVTMPEANKSEPDCDPEGVQMTEKDHNKKAFMGLGALAGMATAPEGEEDLSIGRGALRGVGTGLGVGTGAVTGGLAGGAGGAALGAILGALARGKNQTFSDAMGRGASGGAGLGLLAGIPTGAVYGGYKGNKATKALLDKTAPISEKKKKKDDDKEVKEAAAKMLAYLHSKKS